MNEKLVKEWREKAEQDYLSAIDLIRRKSRPVPDAVCFHCHQAVEKYLKAYLVANNIRFTKTHDLIELLKLCLKADSSFEFIHDLLEQLNPYSVEVRYPGVTVNLKEAKEAVYLMKKVTDFIFEKESKL